MCFIEFGFNHNSCHWLGRNHQNWAGEGASATLWTHLLKCVLEDVTALDVTSRVVLMPHSLTRTTFDATAMGFANPKNVPKWIIRKQKQPLLRSVSMQMQTFQFIHDRNGPSFCFRPDWLLRFALTCGVYVMFCNLYCYTLSLIISCNESYWCNMCVPEEEYDYDVFPD